MLSSKVDMIVEIGKISCDFFYDIRFWWRKKVWFFVKVEKKEILIIVIVVNSKIWKYF